MYKNIYARILYVSLWLAEVKYVCIVCMYMYMTVCVLVLPGQPSAVRTRVIQPDSVLVSWEPPVDGGAVTGYMIGYGEGVPDVNWRYLDRYRRNVTIRNLSQYQLRSSSAALSIRHRKASKLACYGHTMRKQGNNEEDHARPGWTTSRRGQDSPWKSQSE